MADALSPAEALSLVTSIPGIAAVHGIVQPGPHFTYVCLNDRAVDALGRSSESLAGVDVRDVFGPTAEDQLRAILERAVESGGPVPYTAPLPTTDGMIVVDAVVTPYFDDDGVPVQMLWAAVDATGERAAQQALARSEARFRALVHNAFDGVGVVDSDGRYVWASPSLDRLVGLRAGSLLGRSAFELLHPDDVANARRELAETTSEPDGTWIGRVRHTSGEWRIFEVQGTDLSHDPDVGGVVLNVRDITEQQHAAQALQESEREYRRLALHDAVTGLPNRTLFADRTAQALARLDRQDAWLAVLFCDIDGFKWLNDCYGHGVGDEVVVELGHRIAGAVRDSDTVARFGGDEFLVLCPDLGDPDEVVATAERLLAAVRQPLDVTGVDVHLTMSVGIALTNRRGTTTEELVAQADAAMYEAKRHGRDRLAVFDTALLRRARDRVAIGTQFRQAIAEGQLLLHYQPLVDTRTARTAGFEALVRWEHPTRGQLLPGDFVPIIEESDLIHLLDRWVMETAVHQSTRWTADVSINVNVSARRLADPDLPLHVAATLEAAGVAPERLTIEVTESAVIGDLCRSVENISRLRDLGVRVGIDDFGTGHAALAYLRELPVDFLKIDRRFNQALADSAPDRAIVQAIITMAHALGLTVVAEGVETAAQFSCLSALGCDTVQGWYLGHPEPLVEVATRAPA